MDLVKQHDIITLKYDNTISSEFGDRWLEKLKSDSVPLTVIFPANRPEQPIVIRDVYLKNTLLQNLRKAISLRPEKESTVVSSD